MICTYECLVTYKPYMNKKLSIKDFVYFLETELNIIYTVVWEHIAFFAGFVEKKMGFAKCKWRKSKKS